MPRAYPKGQVSISSESRWQDERVSYDKVHIVNRNSPRKAW